MPNLNRVFLMGRLTKNPEVSYTPKGTAIAALDLAVDRIWTDEEGRKHEEATFIDCTLFARVAELVGQYLRKGSPIYLEGHLQYNTWEEGGQKRSKLRVIGENVQFLANKDSAGSPAPRSQPTPSPQSAAREQPAHRTPPNPDLDVPF